MDLATKVEPKSEPVSELEEKKSVQPKKKIKMDKTEDKVWLVKIPKTLAEKWEAFSDAGHQLATMKHKAAIGEKPEEITLHIPNATWSEDIPKNYQLKVSNKGTKNSYVFTENEQGEAEEIFGTVFHEAQCTPIMDKEYRDFLKKKSKINEVKQKPVRTVKKMDEKEERKILFIGGSLKSQKETTNFSTAKKKIKTQDKNERMDRDDLINILFQLFSEEDYFSFKSLVERTKQPQQFLKEVLNDICILNKRGPYKQEYGLKPEFKSKKVEAEEEEEE
ncbi:hypothetical protein HK099_004173 [Clydaea vesicula]|uniref:Transcription initiation factor IIF subunit beta n=1 Tax=Clydaea vesicula TaxID=447962 RepID=A0AAD5U9V9_9FUNG|nr:hypothetical protein HK099_004173 [Clydaea vesicula]KAJ3397255.1 hypothetical protein HDU92_000135 [Lobulomyces angularis]